VSIPELMELHDKSSVLVLIGVMPTLNQLSNPSIGLCSCYSQLPSQENEAGNTPLREKEQIFLRSPKIDLISGSFPSQRNPSQLMEEKN
jgi:hypothetical protein